MPLTVTFLTWNVERRLPTADLLPSLSFLFDNSPDLVILTLQEIDFSVWALVVGTSPQVQPWSQLFDDAGAPHGYAAVTEASLGGVLLKVMKKSTLSHPLSAEIIDSVRLGANGLACNKSAVLASICVAGARIGVIGAHLTAYVERERARTDQVEQLSRAFAERRPDFLVVFGDLNYRVERDFAAAVRLVRAGDLRALLAADQLTRLLSATARPFVRFFEAPITFPPTFCFDPGTDEYDSSPKHRVPAWTDRVLVRTEAMRDAVGPADDVVCETDGLAALCEGSARPEPIAEPSISWPTVPSFLRYAAEPIRISDHRPVSAIVEFRIPIVREERRDAFAAELARRAGEFERGLVPAIEANLRRFVIAKKVEVVLMNRSVTVAKWAVEAVPDGVAVEPSAGELVPAQTRPVVVTFDDGASDCMVAVLVENGSPLLLEFVTA
jgi:endonuclease/exonuclease/phosphatase family metal-dependent hydrolase